VTAYESAPPQRITPAFLIFLAACFITWGAVYLFRDPLFIAETKLLADAPIAVTVALAWAVVAFPIVSMALGSLDLSARPLRRPWGGLAGAGFLLLLAQIVIMVSRPQRSPRSSGLPVRESLDHRVAAESSAGEALAHGLLWTMALLVLWALVFSGVRWTRQRLRGERSKFFQSLWGIAPVRWRLFTVGAAISVSAGLAAALSTQ
jgi:hypothetical protein